VTNLALLCTFHHHLVHEGGWSVARGEDGELEFTAPDGRALTTEPPRQTVEAVLESLHEWAADRGLDLGPDSNYRSQLSAAMIIGRAVLRLRR